MAKRTPPVNEKTAEPTDTTGDAPVQVTRNVTGEGEPPTLPVPVLDDDATGLLDGLEMPEVRENVMAEAEAAETESQVAATLNDPPGTPIKGKTDEKGRPYDPAIHESPMRMNKSGFIAAKRGGAGISKKTGKPIESRVDTSTTSAVSTTLQPDAKIETSATTCAGLFFIGAMTVGGDDLAPDEAKNEKDIVKGYFADYFKASGVVDIPPGIALAVGLGMYVVNKWNKPTFVARRLTMLEKAKRWWNDFKWRRQNSQANNVAQVPSDVKNG